jgi:hypothetical protein
VQNCSRAHDGADPLAFVISKNLKRRHLNESQRSMVAARLATLQKGDNQHSSIELTSQAQASELLNVSVPSIKRARTVPEHGMPELIAAVERGEIAVSGFRPAPSPPRGAPFAKTSQPVGWPSSATRRARGVPTRAVCPATRSTVGRIWRRLPSKGRKDQLFGEVHR